MMWHRKKFSDIDFPINRWVMLAGVLTAFILTHSIAFNFIVEDEKTLQSAYRPEISLISARSDSRLGNRFSSTPSELGTLIQREPGLTVLLEVQQPVSFLGPKESDSGSAVFPSSYTKIFFVPANFFKFIRGDYHSFDRRNFEDVMAAGSNSAIISRGLCEKVFGVAHGCPSQVFIRGRPFKIAGVMSFKMSQSEENHALYLPFEAISLVADPKKVFISKFALRDNREETLNRLKSLIDKQQLKARKPASRPSFEPAGFTIRPNTKTIASEKLVPLGFLLRFCLLFFVVSFLGYFAKKLWTDSSWVTWRRSLGRSPESIAREAVVLFLGPFFTFQFVALLVAGIVSMTVLIRRDHSDIVGLGLLSPFPWVLTVLWIVLPIGVYAVSLFLSRLIRPNYRE